MLHRRVHFHLVANFELGGNHAHYRVPYTGCPILMFHLIDLDKYCSNKKLGLIILLGFREGRSKKHFFLLHNSKRWGQDGLYVFLMVRPQVPAKTS